MFRSGSASHRHECLACIWRTRGCWIPWPIPTEFQLRPLHQAVSIYVSLWVSILTAITVRSATGSFRLVVSGAATRGKKQPGTRPAHLARLPSGRLQGGELNPLGVPRKVLQCSSFGIRRTYFGPGDKGIVRRLSAVILKMM